MKIVLEICRATVVTGFGEDIVRLKTLLPSPYGDQYPGAHLSLEFKTPEREGGAYLTRVFGPDLPVEEFCGGTKPCG